MTFLEYVFLSTESFSMIQYLYQLFLPIPNKIVGEIRRSRGLFNVN